MDLDELFSKKLENSEMTPGEAARKSLMKKLSIREFIRFNPSRFNIYYLGGVVAAAIAATLLISSDPGAKKENEINPSKKDTDTVVIPVENALTTDRVTKNTGAARDITANNKSVVAAVKQDNKIQNKNKNEETATGREETGMIVKDKLSDNQPEKTTTIKENLVKETSGDISIQKKPYADFSASVVSGCIPLKVKFINRSAWYDTCIWSFGDGGYSNKKDAEWIFDLAGEYKITLKIYGESGTESFSTQTVTVHPKPLARFETFPEKPIIPDDAISFVNYSTDADKYRWEFGDGRTSDAFEPEHLYGKYASYNVRLIAWNQYGCSDTLTIENAFAVSGCYIDLPNAFIPNADGPSGGYYSTKSDEAAQVFHPVTSGVSEYQLRIFSKTGILIFESNDINIGWDGYNKGKLCEPGVYVWKVRGTFKNGEPFVKMGDVTIIKN